MDGWRDAILLIFMTIYTVGTRNSGCDLNGTPVISKGNPKTLKLYLQYTNGVFVSCP